MIEKMFKFLRFLEGLPRQVKLFLRCTIETTIVFSLYFIGKIFGYISEVQWSGNNKIYGLIFIFWLLCYFNFSLHKDKLKFSSFNSYIQVVKAVAAFYAFLFLVHYSFLFANIVNMSILFLITVNFIILWRLIVRQSLRAVTTNKRENILICGTSENSLNLHNAFLFSHKFNVVGFVDFLSKHRHMKLSGLPVVSGVNLDNFVQENSVEFVILPHGSQNEPFYVELLNVLEKLEVRVSLTPTLDKALNNEVQLIAMSPEDLIERKGVNEYNHDVFRAIEGSVVVVTGAGGSIGSELSRVLHGYAPRRLILVESNEFSLYSLEQEFGKNDTNTQNVKVDYKLGSICDEQFVKGIFESVSVDFVFHAAAYKHVPMLEENILAAIKNNVFGTKVVSDLASQFNVKKFVLVSTDKAVRPTNIMGATKRLTELVCQTLYSESSTTFSVVRFGNVLGSSGSVIPKFKEQIMQGGPVTVTHRDVTRYFMSISEAAYLVITAGIRADKGSTFLLDMGHPVKIKNLAMKMIRHHGLKPVFREDLRDRPKKSHEILIDFVGLRPGEKLYEELLVDDTSQITKHDKIFTVKDAVVSPHVVESALDELTALLENSEAEDLKLYMQTLPLDFSPATAETDEPEDYRDEGDENDEVNGFDIKDNLEIALVAPRSIFARLVSNSLHWYFLCKRGVTLGARAAIYNREGKVLLVRHTYVTGWYLPGGGVDRGESILEAAYREVREETGLSKFELRDHPVMHHNSAISSRDYVAYYIGRCDEAIDFMANSEIAECRYFSPDTLPPDVNKECLKFIQEASYRRLT